MAVEPITPLTPRPVRHPILTQSWQDLTFLHWPVEPTVVAGLLPEGTRPDTINGATWVGLIPFQMKGIGVWRGPGLPWVGTFAETNVRFYSVDRAGRRGVVFRSLDATRLISVLTARVAFGLPYLWSSMQIHHDGDVMTYSCRRRSRPRATTITSRVVVRVGEPIAEPGELERFLTSRWGLHVAWRGRTLYLPNDHPEWPLRRAELLDLDDDLVARAGLPGLASAPPSIFHSPGVPVTFGLPSVIRDDDPEGTVGPGPRGALR